MASQKLGNNVRWAIILLEVGVSLSLIPWGNNMNMELHDENFEAAVARKAELPTLAAN